ncbi:hypothetical protein E2C01_081302 [Portunus trituberculatus]|uniref:Uncharacterized protein n=1 Tax=Portunus trituberculatus TaxID=210409 RepID=A0A5B7IRK6_PORTR|nr:hypothetical protein [Portunus trituberculatus]
MDFRNCKVNSFRRKFMGGCAEGGVDEGGGVVVKFGRCGEWREGSREAARGEQDGEACGKLMEM